MTWHLRGEGRNPGIARTAGGRDHGIAAPVPVIGVHLEPVGATTDRLDRDPAPHRRIELPAVPVEELHRVRRGHEPVGVIALVPVAGEHRHPVRGEQPERVPAFVTPRVRHLTALEHHVIDAGPGEVMAHRQTSGAGAHDHDRDVHGPGQARATRTVVGLVTTSKTAERFCDCATIASRSARDASASMS